MTDYLETPWQVEKQVAYVTDIEGNLDYWDRYIDLSSVLRTSPSRAANGRRVLHLKANCELVFGGDVCDRGPGDIRITSEILDLKERYPNRVHIILGNRDVNKYRILFETTPEALAEAPMAYWLKNKDGSPYDYLADKAKQDGPDSVADRLKWMFPKTMGSPDCFNFRAQELGEMGEVNDDDSVARNFVEHVKPGGVHAKFVAAGQIAHIIGDTLFVHGGINTANQGYVPPYGAKREQFIPTLREWVEEINKFAKSESRDYAESMENYVKMNPTDYYAKEGGYKHQQPGSRLVHYGMGPNPDGSTNTTVIYSNFLVNGKPTPMDTSVTKWLQDGGVNRVVVGHQPHGDAPLVIQCANGVQVVTGDTSYAKDAKYQSNLAIGSINLVPPHRLKDAAEYGTRGIACSEIVLSPSCAQFGCSVLRIRGNLQNGTEYDFTVPDGLLNDKIGLATADGWWVKGDAPTGEGYYLSKQDGFRVDNTFVSKDQISLVLRDGVPNNV